MQAIIPSINMSGIGSATYHESKLIEDKGVVKSRRINEAKELLKNGILVETNKGLVCMSLKDALSNGVGGHILSAEDFQSVATQLLFQEEPTEISGNQEPEPLWIENSALSHDIFKQKKTNLAIKTDANVNSKSFTVQTPLDTKLALNQEKINEIKGSLNYSHFEVSLPEKFEKFTKELQDISSLLDKKALPVSERNLNKPVNKKSLILKSNMKSVIAVQSIIKKLSDKKKEVSHVNNLIFNSESVLIKGKESAIINSKGFNENCVSCEETSDNSEVTSIAIEKPDGKPVKKRGGWPKGRKRKPEVKNEIRPPKAPATGYVIYLNERRKEFRDMPFTEVTKLLGNEWSKLSLEEKKVYLDQAEIEKKRYREELKLYRQSDAYQLYLQKKRMKRLQGNATEESDMDATDEIDDEDNEELYCRSCDQWFHSLHNKKEHLYGRQHLQSLAFRHSKVADPDGCNANMSSTSLDESSLDGSSYLKVMKEHCCNKVFDSLNMDDVMVRFMVANKEREQERRILLKKLDESKAKNLALTLDFEHLNETMGSLTCMAESERTTQILLEQKLFNLLNVPTLFYLPEPLNDGNNE